jgi:hypothetical protein
MQLTFKMPFALYLISTIGIFNSIHGLPLFNMGDTDNIHFINALIVNNSIHLKYNSFTSVNTINNGLDNTIIDIYPITEPYELGYIHKGHGHGHGHKHNNIKTQYIIYDGALILQYKLNNTKYECIMDLKEDQTIAEFIYLNKRHYYTTGKTMLIYCNSLMCKKEKLSCNTRQMNKKIEL